MNGDEGMMGEKYLIPNTTLKTHSDGHYIFSICWLLFLQGWETFKMESSCEFCPKMGSKTLVNQVTTHSSKHLTKQNIWMSISSLILVNNPTSVLNATNHVPLQVNFEATWWLTLGRNCTSVNNAASHLLNLELSICSHINRRNLTVVSNATAHSIKLEIWRTTC